MIQDDYILRIISQFIQSLAYVVGLRKDKQYDLALAAIANAFQQMLGLRAGSISRLSESGLISLLTLGESPAAGRDKALLAVALLNETAEIHAAESRLDESVAARLKALNLLLEVTTRYDAADFPSYAPSVPAVLAALSDYRLPRQTSLALFAYFERSRAYDRAENVLFDMLDDGGVRDGLLDLGREFYLRLQQRPDSDLAAGRLPRPEVQAGLAELLARASESSAAELEP